MEIGSRHGLPENQGGKSSCTFFLPRGSRQPVFARDSRVSCTLPPAEPVHSSICSMIELFAIFGKGGLVLWCFKEGQNLFKEAVNNLVSDVLLQVGAFWLLIHLL